MFIWQTFVHILELKSTIVLKYDNWWDSYDMVCVFPLWLLQTGTVCGCSCFQCRDMHQFSFGCVDIQHQDLTAFILRATGCGGESWRLMLEWIKSKRTAGECSYVQFVRLVIWTLFLLHSLICFPSLSFSHQELLGYTEESCPCRVLHEEHNPRTSHSVWSVSSCDFTENWT